MRRSFIGPGLAVLAALAGGCGEQRPAPEIPVRYADSPPATAHGDDDKPAADSPDVLRTGPFSKSFEGISFQVPKGWQETKLSSDLAPFVDSRFVIPAKEGTVELTCLASGGGIDDNVSRWIGQFDAAPGGVTTESLDVDGASASWVDLHGTFNSNSSGKPGPHRDWRMLGAGIPAGSKNVFLKLNGPAAAVAEIRDEFRDFVKGARIE
jgi:hypothetical protein